MHPAPSLRRVRRTLLALLLVTLLAACGADAGTEPDAGSATSPAIVDPATSPPASEAASDLEGDAPSPY